MKSDAALRRRLEALLAALEQPESLLATQAEAARPTIKLDPADAPDEAVGQTLGRYRLLEQIGEGGCGMVYVAEQKEPVRRKVALKVIKLGMDTRGRRAFRGRTAGAGDDGPPEHRQGARRGHDRDGPSLLRHGTGAGRQDHDYCDQANLSTKERLDLFIKVCQAIQHAHQKGIIHRDTGEGTATPEHPPGDPRRRSAHEDGQAPFRRHVEAVAPTQGRPGLDRDEVPGEGPPAPLRHGQRPCRRHQAASRQ